MADPDRAVAVLHELRELGVPAVGRRLRHRLLVAVLPAAAAGAGGQDRPQLRRGAGTRASENVAIVRAIVDLGRNLGLEVVAEGVEDQATWDLLASMGCDLVQGWHLARAMPIDDLLPWLATREVETDRGPARRLNRPPC